MIKLSGIVDLKAISNGESVTINEATRSQIGVIDKSGNILSTYVHYDGYPEGVGKIAKKHYNGAKVKQLLKIDKGAGISSLEKDIKGAKGDWQSPCSIHDVTVNIAQFATLWNLISH